MAHQSFISHPEIMMLEEGDIGKVKLFLRKFYGEHFYGADDRYFDWLYMQNPCQWFAPYRQNGLISVNAVVDSLGELEAIHAFLPFDAINSNGGAKGVWDVEWINGSERRGVGRMLAQALLDAADLYAGYGCNDLSARAFAKMGMQVFPEIHRAVFVMDENILKDLIGGIEPNIHEIPIHASGSKSGAGDWKTVNCIAELSDTLCDSHLQKVSLGAGRSEEWLKWRYENHPYIDYDIVIPQDCDGDVAAIVRREEIENSEYCVVRILELFAPRSKIAQLLKACLGFAQNHDAVLIDYFNASEIEIVNLLRIADEIGWKGQQTPRLPYMFQPLAYGTKNAPNIVVSSGDLEKITELSLSQFWASKGDSNQDVLRSSVSAPDLKVNKSN